MFKYVIFVFMVIGVVFADISFEPISELCDVMIDSVTVEGVTYHTISVVGFPLPMDGIQAAGLPSVPFTCSTFLLPLDTGIDTIEVVSTTWDTLPGKYYLYPAQTSIMRDTVFVLPDPEVYSSSDPFPSLPVQVSGQGSALGYSVVTLSGTPVRYIPADSILMVLTSVTLNVQLCPSPYERIEPLRETEWSAAVRERGILMLVSNPLDIDFYSRPEITSFENRTSPLNILDSPSIEEDGVDMVIITNEILADDFQVLAEYRTEQGIITVVRTIEWIEGAGGYSGYDTQERIRNFISDAHEKWGTQAILLGGDDWIVPVRECGSYLYASYYCPADDYYADIDGNWIESDRDWWIAPDDDYYVDLVLGRWPVDDSEDVQLLMSKLQLYECPEAFPDDFARKALFIGGSAGSNEDGYGAAYEEYLNGWLVDEGIAGEVGQIGQYLDEITELYYPQSGDFDTYFGNVDFYSAEELRRSAALAEFDNGYNLIIHFDHSDTHKIGAPFYAESGEEDIFDFDFSTMANIGEPSILWTAGCWPGHFEGADCFAEAGLLVCEETGLVAVIANARSGHWSDWTVYYSFVDALYPFGWIVENPDPPVTIGPVSSIGEAYRYSMNYEGSFNWANNPHKSMQHLFGDPVMFVWRDDPHHLAVEATPAITPAGTFNVTVLVTDPDDNNNPVSAKVCLYKDGDVFAVGQSNTLGIATFNDVEIANPGSITVTAIKRRTITVTGNDVSNFIPAQDEIMVLNPLGALVHLENRTLDDDNLGQSLGNDDGLANPGETIELDLTVGNSGMSNAYFVTAQLSLISGDVLILDDFVSIGNIFGGQSVDVNDAFRLKIDDDADPGIPVLMEVHFSYNGGSGTWDSPCNLTIYSDNVQLPLRNVSVEYDEVNNITTIDVTDVLAANIGLGGVEDAEITIDNFNPDAQFFGSATSVIGDLDPDEAKEVYPISVRCIDPPEEWTEEEENYPDCSFSLIIEDRWGQVNEIPVNVVDYESTINPEMPVSSDFEAVEAGQDYINVEWDYENSFEGGFYLYYKVQGSADWNRLDILPVPVKTVSFTDLQSGTVYNLAVTAVDLLGRESELCEMPDDGASTTCPIVAGWPIQLQGCTGPGPLAADIDGDGFDEIIVATSFGRVYIIERNGSIEVLPDLPPGTNIDYFAGCAVGNIDTDPYDEIVITCQVSVCEEEVGLVVYNRNLAGEWSGELCFEANESGTIPALTGVPVLLQADGTQQFEIAFRTRYSCRLYLLRWDSGTSSLVEYDGFPILLSGDFFTAPIAVDYDNDGFDELLITYYEYGNSTNYIYVADFDRIQTPFIERNIDLGVLGEGAGVYSSLAAVEWNDHVYVIGVAKKDHDAKKIFVFDLTDWQLQWWHNDWIYNAFDFMGILGGPAIGLLDNDEVPDIVYPLDGSTIWKLLIEEQIGNTGDMNANPHGEWNHSVKSAPGIGGTTFAGSEIQVPFVGFSTLYYGHDPLNGMNTLPGFPVWSEDASWTSPLVIDLDEDGFMEVLTADASGLLTLLDWGGYSTVAGGWPMYQHDPRRTGYYNTPLDNKTDELDMRILNTKLILPEEGSDNLIVAVDVEVTGSWISFPFPETEYRNSNELIVSAPTESEITLENSGVTLSSRSRSPVMEITLETIDPSRSVKVAVYSEDRCLAVSNIPLVDGIHTARMAVPTVRRGNADFIVKLDPENKYHETDRINNVAVVPGCEPFIPETSVFLQNPCSGISLHLNLAEEAVEGLYIRVYSIDGRLVMEETTGSLPHGEHLVRLTETGELPAGLYSIVIRGIAEQELIRRVVVLP